MAAKFAEVFIKLGLKKEGFDKEVKSTKTSFKDMGKSILKTGAIIGGVAAGAVIAGKAIFNMGKAGAQAIQLGESFEFLLEKVGAAPDLLDQLTEATLGTVDSGTLMSSTLTLAAGAGDDLTKMLMESAPQLAKIAKAANKLNPTLGDTAFMYQSIGTGVKRAQPLILDNLGLTIKVGQANEDFAKSIGKTVQELTAEEKSMAILNATLAAGDTLIAQVGGSVDSAADDFARAETELANLKSEWQALISGPVAEGAGAIAKATGNLNEHIKVYGALDDAIKNRIITQEEANEVTNVGRGVTRDYGAIMELVKIKTEEYEKEIAAVTSGLGYSKEAQRDFNWEMLEGTGITDDLAESQRNLKQEMLDLKTYIAGPLGKEYENFAQKQSDLRDEIVEVNKKITEFEQMGDGITDDQVIELEEARLKYKELQDAYKENADQHDEATKRIMFNLLQQQAAINGTTAVELDALNKIALEWGLVDQATFDYVNNAKLYFQILEDDSIETMGIVRWELEKTMGISSDLQGAFGELSSSLEGLSGTYDIKIRAFYERAGNWEGPVAPGPTDEELFTPYVEPKATHPDKGGAHGLNMIVPPGYPGDSFPILATSGEHVQITPRGERRGGGGGNTYNSIRYGDQNIVTNPAQAAFLVEKQRQAQFDKIDRVI